MQKIKESDLRVARSLALENGTDLIHALGCLECGLREEFLFILGVLGWDEGSFLRAHYTYLTGREL